jgi:hypothetical protein
MQTRVIFHVLKEKRNGEEVKTIEKHSPNSIWTETQLSKFGFKCIMNKHDSSTEGRCEFFLPSP